MVVLRIRVKRGWWLFGLTAFALALVLAYFGGYAGGSQGSSSCREPAIPEFSQLDLDFLSGMAFEAFSSHFQGAEDPDFPHVYDGMCHEVYVLYRVGGRRMGSDSFSSQNLAESVYRAGLKILREDSCRSNLKCYGEIEYDDLDELSAEVFVLGPAEKVADEKRLYSKRLHVYGGEYEPGVHALRLVVDGDPGEMFLNDATIVGNIDNPKLIDRLCERQGLDECVNDPGVDFEVMPVLHFVKPHERAGATRLFRVSKIQATPPSLDEVSESLSLMNQWLVENLNERGYFNYKYYVGSGRYSTANNMIRQLMASRLLAELAQNDSSRRSGHRRNLEYIFSNWYLEEGELGYIYFRDRSKLGAMGMAVRTLSASPLLDEYGREAEKLVNTILYLQDDDGSLNPWYIRPENTGSDDYLLTFYSGEAILGLVEYYERTGEEEILQAAVRSQDYYVKEYVDEMDENYYPAYVPWHTMSLYKLYRITGDEKYADAILTLNDKLLEIQQLEKPRYPDIWGRFFNPRFRQYGMPHSSSTGIYCEGMVYAYEIARMRGDHERMDRYRRSILLASLNIMNMQFGEGDTFYLGHPERVYGALKAGVHQNYIRVDTTQHSADAFTRILKVFSPGEFHV